MAKTRKREEVKKEDTWALEDLYASEQLFEEDCGRLAGMIEEFPKYKGRLKEGSGVLLEMFMYMRTRDSTRIWGMPQARNPRLLRRY